MQHRIITTYLHDIVLLKVGQVGGAVYRPNHPQKKVQATIRLLSLRFTVVSSEDAFVLGFLNYRSAHAPCGTTVRSMSHHFCASAVDVFNQSVKGVEAQAGAGVEGHPLPCRARECHMIKSIFLQNTLAKNCWQSVHS